jgi:alkylation response protein AidB-like acyl-CoA dehydrogenase
VDFRDDPIDAAFRTAVRAWLAQHASQFSNPPHSLEERLTWWRPWQRLLHGAGYAGLAWPREFGGQGASVLQQAIFFEECDLAGAPDRLDVIGSGFAGPTLIEQGSSSQKARFLDPILTGAELWCQLFSEPGAGSDLAALRTRAERVDGGWRIHGQKVWTSAAQIADYAILLARTTDATTAIGAGRARQFGISFFILPMRQEGVQIRPLRQMLGSAEFNEVFLDGAFVPDDLLVGAIDQGWKVAMSTLGYERVAIATGRVNMQRVLKDLCDLVRAGTDAEGRPLGADAVVRQKVAEFYSRVQLQRLTGKRILSGMATGGAPGPEASTAKLFTTPLVEEVCDFALSLMGIGGQAEPETGAPGQARWLRLAYQARGTSIAGGTGFVQRNILAERVLGLPRG